jgi:hypothetical protein
MGLVAAAALSLISFRIMKAIIPAKSHDTWDRRQFVLMLAALVLSWWTVVFAVLAIADPRDRLRRKCRGYGVSALVAACTVVLFLTVREAFTRLVVALFGADGTLRYGWFLAILGRSPDVVCGAILAVWLTLIATRSGKASSSFLDRVGCVIAAAWIILGLAEFLVWRLPVGWLTRSGIVNWR